MRNLICRRIKVNLLTKNQLLENNFGFSLIQVIIVTSLTLIIGSGIANVIQQLQKGQYEIIVKSTALSMRQTILNNITNNASWIKTQKAQTAMICDSNTQLYCNGDATKSLLIKLLDAQGNIVFDSTAPNNGLTASGSLCNTFDPVNGNDSCPIGVKIKWRALCDTPTCLAQQDLLSLEFDLKASSTGKKIPFNPANYNMVEQNRTSIASNDTPLLACARIGKVFVGLDQTFNSHKADILGCVPYDAFVGPPGPPGPQGPPGPPGADAFCP